MREPGQIAAEAWSAIGWESQFDDAKERWAAVEAAVRNAALEEAAKCADQVSVEFDLNYLANEARGSDKAASAIRALKREKPGEKP